MDSLTEMEVSLDATIFEITGKNSCEPVHA